MMTALVLTLAAQPDAAALIGKMFAYYYGAPTMVGSITMSQQLGEKRKAVIRTRLQFESPAKVYIRQDMEVTTPGGNWSRNWLVTGDGVGFSYTPPDLGLQTPQRNRLYETIQIPQPKPNKNEFAVPPKPPLDVRGIYGAVTKSLGDRSLPLDVAFGRKDDLTFIRSQLATFVYDKDDSSPGVPCHLITGDWRDYGNADVSGKFNLWITADGQLKRFARKEAVSVPNGPAGEIVTVWDVDLRKDAKPDPALFKVIL